MIFSDGTDDTRGRPDRQRCTGETDRQRAERRAPPTAEGARRGNVPLARHRRRGRETGQGDGDTGDGDGDDADIDPLYGYSTSNAKAVPESLEPDHTVSLEVAPPDPEAGEPPAFFFEPSGLHVNSGDVVQFTFASPDHTVTAYHPANGFQRRVPEDVPPFSSPVVNAGGAWLYRFETPGVYDGYCGPHHVFGMVMRLVVGDDGVPAYEDTFEGAEDPPLLAPYSRRMLEGELNGFSHRNDDAEWVWLTPTEVLDASALDRARIRDAGSVSFSTVHGELRGGEQTTAGEQTTTGSQ